METRTDKAKELVKDLETGPAIHPAPFTTLTQEQVEEVMREYRIWAETWIIPVVKELCKNDLDPARAAAVMGSARSERKAASSRTNGKKGGRPKTYKYSLSENDMEQLANYIFEKTGTTAKDWNHMTMVAIFERLDEFSRRHGLGWSDDEISDRTRSVFHFSL